MYSKETLSDLMFNKIYIEEKFIESEQFLKIKKLFPKVPIFPISKIDDYFQKAKKPYLQKRETLNLFLGEKKGQLVKLAPSAYGLSGEPHYYYVHAFNCIYECTYCYLQGYFHSPDIVLFLNHEDIKNEMKKTLLSHPEKRVWFHAGEYSDSLALSHVSGEIEHYYPFFKENKNAILELRTKSVNIRKLLQFDPIENLIVSFSLSPDERVKKSDLLTPRLNHRLKAMKKLKEKGFKLAIHFDPIIISDHVISEYKELINEIDTSISIDSIEYISLGVVRFTKEVFSQVKKNYPDADFLATSFTTSFDNKVRYNRPTRNFLMNEIKKELLSYNLAEEKIYLCMEED